MLPPMDRNTEHRLARLTRRQHGLLTSAQAKAAGVSAESTRWRVRVGLWTRVVPGVFAVGGTPDTWRRRTMAAVLAAGPGAVASHTTAAALYGLSRCGFKRVEITVAKGRSHRSRLAVVHETAHLTRHDVTSIDGIPVTRPARTLVDLAGCVARAVLEEAVDDSLVRRLTSLDRLVRRAEALGGPGRTGTIVLAEVLAAWSHGDMAESVAEVRLVRRLVANGLPEPKLQHEVHDTAGRFVARLDLAYPGDRVGLEMNGFRWHATPLAYARDQERLRRLAALGWLFFPPRRSTSPATGATWPPRWLPHAGIPTPASGAPEEGRAGWRTRRMAEAAPQRQHGLCRQRKVLAVPPPGRGSAGQQQTRRCAGHAAVHGERGEERLAHQRISVTVEIQESGGGHLFGDPPGLPQGDHRSGQVSTEEHVVDLSQRAGQAVLDLFAVIVGDRRPQSLQLRAQQPREPKLTAQVPAGQRRHGRIQLDEIVDALDVLSQHRGRRPTLLDQEGFGQLRS